MELMLMINEKIGSYAFHLDIGYFPPRGIPVYGTGYWILSIWLFCWILDILPSGGRDFPGSPISVLADYCSISKLCHSLRAFVSSCENTFPGNAQLQAQK